MFFHIICQTNEQANQRTLPLTPGHHNVITLLADIVDRITVNRPECVSKQLCE